MLEPARIPSNYYLPAKELVAMGMQYDELKAAAQFGGILDRWVSPKTRRVYYKSKNLRLI